MTATDIPLRRIRRLQARAVTIQLKAGDLACEINELFGTESGVSDFADDVLCTVETLAEGLARLPEILKAGGRP